MSDSKARELLKVAGAESRRLERHLLVAAALRKILTSDPIVVGGTAEEYWTADEYHETDLDICVPLTRGDEAALRRFGFRKRGRHWSLYLASSIVAVEFPDSRIDGDESRTVEPRIGPGRPRIIGLDDLYLDRLRQATMSTHEGVEFHSALAVVAAAYDEIDWRYVRNRLRTIANDDPTVGESMKRVDSRIRRRVRRALSEPS